MIIIKKSTEIVFRFRNNNKPKIIIKEEKKMCGCHPGINYTFKLPRVKKEATIIIHNTT